MELHNRRAPPATQQASKVPTHIAFGWPISRSSLDALTDLGMSDALIAHYYDVNREEVAALRRRYGNGARPAEH